MLHMRMVILHGSLRLNKFNVLKLCSQDIADNGKWAANVSCLAHFLVTIF
jgi:hypothetical protein